MRVEFGCRTWTIVVKDGIEIRKMKKGRLETFESPFLSLLFTDSDSPDGERLLSVIQLLARKQLRRRSFLRLS